MTAKRMSSKSEAAKTKKNSPPEMAEDSQSIETLNQRYQALNEKRIQAETKLEEAKRRLEELEKKALEEFGTCDLVKLGEKLDLMKQENEKKRSEFQTRLDEIENNLQNVEDEYQEAS